MSIRKIVKSYSPVLGQRAVEAPAVDAGIRKLMDDMVETMDDAEGVGLAAPQIGVSLRVIVVRVEDRLYHLANPEIARVEGKEMLEEACLSVPGLFAELKRAPRVSIRALDREGRGVRLKGEGLLAQVFQHEVDHLDGILITERVEGLDRLHPARRERRHVLIS